MKRSSVAELLAVASEVTRRLNPGLALPTRLDSPRNDDSAKPVSTPAQPPKRATGQKAAPFGRCPHTGRAITAPRPELWRAFKKWHQKTFGGEA